MASKFKIGDKVVCVNDEGSNGHLSRGVVYKVLYATRCGETVTVGRLSGEDGTLTGVVWNSRRFELADQPPVEQWFEPGDIVLCNEGWDAVSGQFIRKGDIFQVVFVAGKFLGIVSQLRNGMSAYDVKFYGASRFEKLIVEIVEETKETKVWKKLDGTVVKSEAI